MAEMAQPEPEERPGFLHRLLHKLIGRPLDVEDTSLFRHLSLIPILAWIGLGADGLSSSSYGPEEAFRALGRHTHLAVLLAFATAFTVFIISYAYSRIIEHFPHGGGGYIVATHTIGPRPASSRAAPSSSTTCSPSPSPSHPARTPFSVSSLSSFCPSRCLSPCS